jgi:hypothetical protein
MVSQTVADNGPGLLSAQICATPSAQRARRGAIISLAVMMSLLERIAYHESGHAAAALTFGMPIIRVTIDADPPHCHRGRWRSKSDMALANIVTLCLCGPAAEIAYVGPITDNSDHIDHAMARRYLAEGGVDPVLIGVEIGRLGDAADRLVRTDWARRRIGLMAHALLRYGSLTGGQISELF